MLVESNYLTNLELAQNEYVYLVNPQHYSNSSFTVYVPKLMTNISGNKPVNDSFNKQIFVNEYGTAPSPEVKVSVLPYITVPRSPNCSLYSVANHLTGIIPNGTRLKCLCMNNNYRDMIIVDVG